MLDKTLSRDAEKSLFSPTLAEAAKTASFPRDASVPMPRSRIALKSRET